MKQPSKTYGAIIATAAAALFTAAGAYAAGEGEAEQAEVQCFGINACKGQAACKTASNACEGQNACKGQGFVMATAEECGAKGGKVQET